MILMTALRTVNWKAYFKDPILFGTIYYLNQGEGSCLLAQSRVASAGGSREVTTIYTDGTVLCSMAFSKP